MLDLLNSMASFDDFCQQKYDQKRTKMSEKATNLQKGDECLRKPQKSVQKQQKLGKKSYQNIYIYKKKK